MEEKWDASRLDLPSNHEMRGTTGDEKASVDESPWHPPTSWRAEGETTLEHLRLLRLEWEFGLIEDEDYLAKKSKLLADMDFLDFEDL